MKREYPDGPVAAVGCIAFRGESVLLIRRGHEPFKGFWSIPGGAIELGEKAEEALVRETLEEAGVQVRPLRLVGVFDNMVRREGRIWYHYVIMDYLCEVVSGSPKPGDGELDARWVSPSELGRLDLTPQASFAISKGREASRP